MQISDYSKLIEKLPTLGILMFIGLYIYSSTLYPGGSQANLNTIGFDWVNNYWCNLLNLKAMNGLSNPARPFAISGMIILCFSLLLFFIQFSKKQASNKFWKITIQIFGIISMTLASLIFTKYHDILTTLSSIFGVIVVIGIIGEIYKSKMTFYKISGILLIVLLALNNFIYYSKQFIEFLPLVQKITFGFVLTWIIGLNYKLTKKNVLQQRV